MTSTQVSSVASVSPADLTVIDEIIVFVPKLMFFGGSTTLTAEDLGIDTTDLPKDLVALGTKSIVNQDLLNGFKTTRKAIQRRAKLKGAAILNGFGMSAESAKEFLVDINPILDELRTQVESFLDAYPSYVEAWASAHPKWSDKIRQAAPSLQTVRSRFSIKMPFIKIAPPGSELGDGGLSDEVAGMAGQILEEIATDVKATWKDRGYGAQQIKSLLRRISEKAKSLSFINSDLNKVSKLIEATLSTFPSTGKIEGVDYLQLKGLMDMLMQPSEVLKAMKQGDLAVIAVAPEIETEVVSTQIAAPSVDSNSAEVEVFQPETLDVPMTVPAIQETESTGSSWAW
jgi:Protein of unknown function (DUF3150)